MLKYYSKKPRKKFILPLFLVVAGLAAVFYVLSPIALFQLRYAPLINSRSFTSPIPDVLANNVLANSIVNLSGTDYSKASNWFPGASGGQDLKKLVPTYLLSIPKLGIEEAVVSTVSDDLFKNLVHYGGSPLPGEKGNAVVFGHSTLPQLFNPKNYKTIFATLHTIKIGDKVIVKVDGVIYTYSIFNIKIVEPEDISALEQQYDDSYLTLITCTPPGTYWKRLIIKGKLDKLD